MSHAHDAAYSIGWSASAGFGCSRNMNAASVRKKPSTDLSAWRLRFHCRVRILTGGSSVGHRPIASHESPRTTKLYDRTNDQITLDEAEDVGLLKLFKSAMCQIDTLLSYIKSE